MDPARYQQVKAIFHDVVELATAARADVLAARCADDPDLRREVEALLASHERAAAFLSEPALKVKASDLMHDTAQRLPASPAGANAAPVASPVPPAETERVIGAYRLLEVLGEGGMGTVYKAEQTAPVRRLVALKLIKLGMDSREVIARFEAERQALAMMDHPCIAKVLDAGTTERGRPYFVMEYVPGVPINEHADRHNLNTLQRLRLFLDVCDAIHHAHQRAVIHRDLKPSNILVMFQNDRAVPKVIDFGIAKATNHHLTERTVFTEQGRIIGTPEYMSPEQAEMTEQGVDTRTDVYSLGVILYEILAGVLPFSPQELRAQGYSGLQKTIREIEPPRPSTRITTLGAATPAKIAQLRSTDLRTLVRQLRGDLDWIVMKAMAKSRTERYESAFSLSEDIRRFMNDEPVLATRPSLGYRLSKFVKRNRVAVGTAAAVVVALGLGLVIAYRAYRELAGKEIELRTALATARANEQRALENEQQARDSQQAAEAALVRARASETLADTTAKEKEQQVEENEALVAQAIFGELVATADALWPTYPEQVPALEAWGGKMATIAARLPRFVAVRDRLRASALPLRAGVLDAARSNWTFTDPELGMKHGVITKLIDNLERARAPEGLMAQMQWRLDQARSLRARSVDEHQSAWAAAIEAVGESPSYAGMVATGMSVVAQTGLVPLGADPKSGLQEFAHLQTGAVPIRDALGVLTIDADSALVLVLVPGGTFAMGAARTGDINVDPGALDHEGPVHEVELAPFFLSKYEMSQAQWARWVGSNPSYYRAGRTVADVQQIDGTNPVETITWDEVARALRQLGLDLPTEAQWEYAARSGGASVWFTGNVAAELKGFANLAAADSPADWGSDLAYEDGFLVHTSATAVAGNAFGLHHMLGNVSEWCRDSYGGYANPTGRGDGLRVVEESLQRVHRGGSYRSNAAKSRIAARANDPADARSESRGVRPMRRLDPTR